MPKPLELQNLKFYLLHILILEFNTLEQLLNLELKDQATYWPNQ